MEDNGMVHGNLDPRAQEFIPRYPFHQPPNNSLPLLPNQFYYPAYPCPPQLPPPLPPSLPPYGDDVGYHQVTHTAYVSSNPPMPTPFLPPPSSMATRTLLLSMVPVEVSESIVRRDLEVFGDVRAVQMGRLREGIVTVHFYDLRHARAALIEIQEQNMQQQCRLRRHYEESIYSTTMGGLILPPLPFPLPPPARGLIAGRAVWAQFTFPLTSSLPDGNNQGTLVIFNLDSHTSSTYLRDIFQAFGNVKELRETPMKRHQRFVEFYDVRDAARALTEMNGKEIDGKQLLIEFSRPGGNSRRFSRPNYSSPKFSRNSINNNYSPPQKSQRVYTSHSQKSNYGNPSGSESSGSGSVQDSLASLCISNNGRPGKIKNAKTCTKTISPSSSSVTTSSSKQILLQVKSNKPWKQARDYDPRFLINEDAIMESNCSDTRTTVMIKNIPNKYSQKLLLNMLDNHCIHYNEQIADGDDQQQPKSSYDFVYLPIDFINKCNVGYGFVNMTSPQATLRLYKAFHHQSWEVFNSRKICQVTYARLQGIEALKEHFKNSKFPCEAEEYMPVIFSPPRDGKLLTEAVPIVGRGMNPPPLLLSAVTSYKEQEEEEESDSVEQLLVEEVGRLVDDNENGYMDRTNDDKEARNGGVGVGVGVGEEDYDDDNNNDSRSFAASICM
ncbi:protein terminal ear1 homolog [Nicotiana tabacum]|uniref:Protein terminal ear1 homolog n=1 Tax=Nicotiana tabacum TaxID=4097 RepID=A0A1S4CA86_TOBAC|nr:PREDICTED: protein terminal ear1 homolog [Nicotiana tabacum]